MIYTRTYFYVTYSCISILRCCNEYKLGRYARFSAAVNVSEETVYLSECTSAMRSSFIKSINDQKYYVVKCNVCSKYLLHSARCKNLPTSSSSELTSSENYFYLLKFFNCFLISRKT